MRFLHFMGEGGWAMWFVLALGLVTVAAALGFALKPASARQDAVRSFSLATSFMAVSAVSLNLAAVGSKVPNIPALANSPTSASDRHGGHRRVTRTVDPRFHVAVLRVDRDGRRSASPHARSIAQLIGIRPSRRALPRVVPSERSPRMDARQHRPTRTEGEPSKGQRHENDSPHAHDSDRRRWAAWARKPTPANNPCRPNRPCTPLPPRRPPMRSAAPSCSGSAPAARPSSLPSSTPA